METRAHKTQQSFLETHTPITVLTSNAGRLKGFGKLIARNHPDVLVLQDINHAKGTEGVARIKRLHQKVVVMAKRNGLKVIEISDKKLRQRILGNESGTKHEMAELLAKRFPDDLASLLPRKRKLWENEDERMDVFDAVGLVVATNRMTM